MSEVKTEFGKNLEKIMRTKGVGPAQLAERLGVHRNNVYRWFYTESPQWHTVHRISRALKCRANELIGVEER